MPGVLTDAFTQLPPPADEQAAGRALEHLRDGGREGAKALLRRLESDSNSANLFRAVFGASGFLTRIILREPAFALSCLEQEPHELFNALLADVRRAGLEADNQSAIMDALRIAKRRAALLVALADLARRWPLEEITRRLTLFADAAVNAAIAFSLRKAAGQGKFMLADPDDPARGCGYVALAMGKLGACELNYSSDIDLIILYDPERAPLAAGVEPATFFVRLTRQIVSILQDPTGEGYVFRVDLRLRPDPGSTQVAIAVEAAAAYYETMGQNWERAAMIKARACAGDRQVGEAFLERLEPYIWRKYLDFAAIADVQSLKRQIHAVKGHGEIAVAGHNIKLGRGGIREIEFFVQTQQLIAGGRNPRLRGRSTCGMLDALAGEGWIERKVAEELKSAYRFLRTLEHRLQMLEDQQTHTLPADQAGLERLARFAGFNDAEEMARILRQTLETVQGHYNALFEEAPELATETGSLVFTGGEDDPETLQTLERMGFARPKEASRIVRGWHYGRYRATRSASARERLTELVPHLLAAFARSGEADAALVAFDRFLQGLPAGLQLFSLLKANTHLLDLLVMILGAAPLLAEELSRRPRLFDAVLDADFFGPLPDVKGYRELVAAAVPDGLAFEDALDRARMFAGEQKFRIGVRMISETVSPPEASAAYTALAEALIARMLAAVEAEITSRHGRIEAGRVAIIAMGKLGGREMTATSDLDLILVCDHARDAAGSDGARSLGPGQYYARLTQRLISALSAPTAEGVLYEVDMRLRPSGSQGPVATHLESFRRYHEVSAWTWEHLALIRARVIAGDHALAEEIEAIIHDALTRQRDAAKVKADVLDMRQRIISEKPPRSNWDVKNVPGGLIDVEFVTQTLQLLNAHANESVLDQNTQTALNRLFDAAVLDKGEHEALAVAAGLYHHLTHILRLCVREGFSGEDAPEGLRRLIANAAGEPDLPAAEARLADARRDVLDAFERHIGPFPQP